MINIYHIVLIVYIVKIGYVLTINVFIVISRILRFLNYYNKRFYWVRPFPLSLFLFFSYFPFSLMSLWVFGFYLITIHIISHYHTFILYPTGFWFCVVIVYSYSCATIIPILPVLPLRFLDVCYRVLG